MTQRIFIQKLSIAIATRTMQHFHKRCLMGLLACMQLFQLSGSEKKQELVESKLSHERVHIFSIHKPFSDAVEEKSTIPRPNKVPPAARLCAIDTDSGTFFHPLKGSFYQQEFSSDKLKVGHPTLTHTTKKWLQRQRIPVEEWYKENRNEAWIKLPSETRTLGTFTQLTEKQLQSLYCFYHDATDTVYIAVPYQKRVAACPIISENIPCSPAELFPLQLTLNNRKYLRQCIGGNACLNMHIPRLANGAVAFHQQASESKEAHRTTMIDLSTAEYCAYTEKKGAYVTLCALNQKDKRCIVSYVKAHKQHSDNQIVRYFSFRKSKDLVDFDQKILSQKQIHDNSSFALENRSTVVYIEQHKNNYRLTRTLIPTEVIAATYQLPKEAHHGYCHIAYANHPTYIVQVAQQFYGFSNTQIKFIKYHHTEHTWHDFTPTGQPMQPGQTCDELATDSEGLSIWKPGVRLLRFWNGDIPTHLFNCTNGKWIALPKALYQCVRNARSLCISNDNKILGIEDENGAIVRAYNTGLVSSIDPLINDKKRFESSIALDVVQQRKATLKRIDSCLPS